MGSLRQASNLFIWTFAKNQKCFMDISWSVRAGLRARFQCTAWGMWPVNVKNVKCQNIDHVNSSDVRRVSCQSQSLHKHCPKWNLQHMSPFFNCQRPLLGHNTFVNTHGGVVSSFVFDRLFSTSGFKHTNAEHGNQKPNPVTKKIGANLKDSKENVMTVPNLLTMSRIVLSPAIGYLVIMESYAMACGIFVFVGITDVLDGWIARTYPSQASYCGSFLDPLADKFLVTVLFISLTMVELIPWPLTGLILARDFLLVAAAFYIRYITLPPPRSLTKYFDATTVSAQLKPTFISKVNTAVQLSLVALSLGAPVFGYVDHVALQGLWYLTAGTTFASGLTYLFAKNTFETLRKSKDTSGL